MRKLILLSFLLALCIPPQWVQAQVGTLWGTTPTGGSANQGVLFKTNADGTNYTIKQDFSNATSYGNFPHGLTQGASGKFYGITDTGGANNIGLLFEFDPATETFVRKFSFGPAATTGSNPKGLLTLVPNGLLYGITYIGGSSNKGVIFNYEPGSGVFNLAYEFSGAATGTNPMAGMTFASNNKLYGLTYSGGTSNTGVLFEYDPINGGFAKKADLTTATGFNPYGGLTEVGGKLYGLTSDGGSFSRGTLFEYDLITGVLTKKLDLGVTNIGAYPRGGLTQAPNGKLYGLTSRGGGVNSLNDVGVLFEYNPATNVYTAKLDFDAIPLGSTPYGNLGLATDGTFYGMTSVGGTSDKGVLFQYNPANNIITKRLDFNGTNGGTPYISNIVLAQRAPQTITFSALPAKSFGDAPFTLSATASSGLPVSYTSTNTAVATVSGNTVTIVGGGTTTIRAFQAGNDSYLLAPYVEQTLTVNKVNQTITFSALSAQTFGPSFTLSATSSSGLPVTYISTNTSVATVSGNTVTMVGVGSTTIRASQAGNATYNAAASVDQALVISKGDQTITFGALPTKTVGNAAFVLTATSSSGLSISYTSSNSAVATVSGSTVTIIGGGTTIITASQPGNANYNAAVDVPQTLTVSKSNQTITFLTLSAKTMGDAPFALTAGSSALLPVSYTSSNPSVASVSGSTVTIVSAGSTTITASQAGNSFYNAAPDVTQVLTVNKISQTITFSALPAKRYLDDPFVLSASTTSGLPITYASDNPAVATISGSTLTIVGAGSATITASQSGNASYSAATNSRVLTVSKAVQDILFGSLAARTVGDAAFALTATASSGLPVSFASSNTAVATVSGNMVTIVGGGTTTITASQAGDANYAAAASFGQILTVNKLNQSITFPALPSKAYGDADFTLTQAASSGLDITYTSSNTAVATVNGNLVSIKSVGSTNIVASQSGNAMYYAATGASRTLTVTKGNQTVTFGALPVKTIGDAAFTLTASASSGLGVTYTSSNSAVATISGSTVTITGAGTTTITATQLGNTLYNASSAVAQVLTVNKMAQTITFPALPAKALADSPFVLTATASSGLGVSYYSSDGNVATVSGNMVTIRGVGTCTITAGQAGNATYSAAAEVARVLIVNEVNKTPQTITFASLPARTFGGAPFTLSASASSGLVVSYTSSNANVAAISGNTVTLTGAGTCTITASQAGNTTYGAAGNVEQLLTVNKADQTITFTALPAKKIGNAPFTLAAAASSSLPVSYTSSNAAVATVNGNQVTIVGAGTTTITASQAGNVNYNAAASVQQNLTVTEKTAQTITFSSLSSKTYGDLPFALSASASSGLAVAYTSSNTSVATISGNMVTITGAGTCTISASQSGDDNYLAAGNVEQQLIVTRADQTITFATLPIKSIANAPFTLSATASSSLTVSYTSSNTAVATINGNEVTIVGAGTTQITASQAGDSNYKAAADVQQSLTVNEKTPQTITFTSLPAKAFNDASFTLSATSTSGLAISYTSSNTNVATVSGNTVTIAGVGTTTLTARQTGNETFNAAEEVTQLLTVTKASQVITFAALADKTLGDTPFNVSATSNSPLTVALTSSSDKITLAGTQVTLVKAGRVSLIASQAGSANYLAAAPVERSFCIKPAKPSISISNSNTESPLLTSSASAGNQWYLNGAVLPGATNASLTAAQPGIYKVQVTVDDCASEFTEKTLIVTGDIDNHVQRPDLRIYPNPATDWLTLTFNADQGGKEVAVYDLTGKLMATNDVTGKETRFNVSEYSQGIYLIKIISGSSVSFTRFVKQ